MAIDFFYDSQLRRYLLQFVRIFNQFQYRSGRDANGNSILKTIPATLASMDRQVASIIQNNSENMLLSTPQISCWISSLKRVPERIQDPNFVRTINVYERAVDQETKKYNATLGNIYNIESYMPVPYDLFMQTDIWTSSELQKQQILEQILVLFNPSIDLQTGDNPFDWTSLTIVEMQDITWSSRTYPAGTSDNIDIATLTFRIPIWLNAPSKVKRQNIINQIVLDIGQMEQINEENGAGYYFSDDDLISRLIVTPNNVSIEVTQEQILLLNPANSILDIEGKPLSWITLLQKYGRFRNGVSQIRLKRSDSDIDNNLTDVIATVQLNPNDQNSLFWTIDIQTLPANTLPAVTAVIDPQRASPGRLLDAAAFGQRYLILNNVPHTPSWPGITNENPVHENDIIEYDGTNWIKIFDADNHQQTEYLLNSRTGQQLLWNKKGWVLSIEGEYAPGFWRLAL